MRNLATAFLIIATAAMCSAGENPYRLYPEMGPWIPDSYTFPNHLCIFPDGRTTLANAKYGDCDLVITFLEHRINGQWVREEYDDSGIMLDWGPGNVRLCGQDRSMLSVAGPPYILYSTGVCGGGHSAVDSTGAPISSAVIWWAPEPDYGTVEVDLYINSPDINGDLVVNLTDYTLFSVDYNGSYNYRSDFNFDGYVNMGDLTILAGALGVDCP
jgi:hypothetical protein